jgi:hypothetical protein
VSVAEVGCQNGEPAAVVKYNSLALENSIYPDGFPTFYIDLLRKDELPGASSNGFNENLALFASGKAAMWIDATSGAGPLYEKSQSQVSDKVAFATAPIEKTPNGSHWLWS